MTDVVTLTYSAFAVLAVLCSLLQIKIFIRSNVPATNNINFASFQRKFFTPYFLALFSDWLQGPYVYKLYSSYGFLESQIALLYVVGFASSAAFGTFSGILADRFGRRRLALAFCVIYASCCLTKISPNFYVLLVGRILGGIATSILFSAFESWYVCEHNERHAFPGDWMSLTFSRVTFWNGLLAIVAGIVANVFAESFQFGPIAPFLIAVPVLLLALVFVSLMWEENYGGTQEQFVHSCTGSLRQIFTDKLILMLGIIISLFESVMYMFIFIWTPILDPYGMTPLGIVFGTFMICVMIGSSVPQILSSMANETILKLALILGTLSMMICFLSTSSDSGSNAPLAYVGFVLLEISVGIYFPTVSVLRSKIVPESYRASIMNWFRLPMNVITCCGLLWLHSEHNKGGNHQIFTVCLTMMILALAISVLFARKLVASSTNVKVSKSDEEDTHNESN